MPGFSDPEAVRAVVVLKTVSQPAVNRQLLVRVTEMCSRTSGNVQTSNHRAATAAVLRNHAVLQQPAAMAAA